MRLPTSYLPPILLPEITGGKEVFKLGVVLQWFLADFDKVTAMRNFRTNFAFMCSSEVRFLTENYLALKSQIVEFQI